MERPSKGGGRRRLGIGSERVTPADSESDPRRDEVAQVKGIDIVSPRSMKKQLSDSTKSHFMNISAKQKEEIATRRRSGLMAVQNAKSDRKSSILKSLAVLDIDEDDADNFRGEARAGNRRRLGSNDSSFCDIDSDCDSSFASDMSSDYSDYDSEVDKEKDARRKARMDRYLRRGSVTKHKIEANSQAMQSHKRASPNDDSDYGSDYDSEAERRRRYLRRGSVTKYSLDAQVTPMQPTSVGQDSNNLPRPPLPPPPAASPPGRNSSHKEKNLVKTPTSSRPPLGRHGGASSHSRTPTAPSTMASPYPNKPPLARLDMYCNNLDDSAHSKVLPRRQSSDGSLDESSNKQDKIMLSSSSPTSHSTNTTSSRRKSKTSDLENDSGATSSGRKSKTSDLENDSGHVRKTKKSSPTNKSMDDSTHSTSTMSIASFASATPSRCDSKSAKLEKLPSNSSFAEESASDRDEPLRSAAPTADTPKKKKKKSSSSSSTSSSRDKGSSGRRSSSGSKSSTKSGERKKKSSSSSSGENGERRKKRSSTTSVATASTASLSCSSRHSTSSSRRGGVSSSALNSSSHSRHSTASLSPTSRRSSPQESSKTKQPLRACLVRDDSKRSATRKNVSFGDLTITEFPIILGDNPAVTSGAPVTIDWNPQGEVSYQIDVYESVRGTRRRRKKLLISVSNRAILLLAAGYSIDDIADASINAQQIKFGRQESMQNQRWDGINVMMETTNSTLVGIAEGAKKGIAAIVKPTQHSESARTA